jgi:Kef-type K+ transport system membrane component KefB/nucleotide-binding universal stress UspA family protein
MMTDPSALLVRAVSGAAAAPSSGAVHTLVFLLLDLALIIAACRAFGALARRVGQPAVIGEIVAGIVLGPSVLGRLIPGAPAWLFPAAVPLRQFADLGLVMFMFLVGLELDTQLIRREGRRAFAISLGGVLAPFIMGALLGFPLFAVNGAGQFLPDAPGAPTQLAFSLFLGAAMCITAFPVLARILIERGLYKSPLGTSALCAAAVDDVIAWCLLAGVVGLTRTGTALEALRAVALGGVFVLGMTTVGRRALQALVRRQEGLVGHVTVDFLAAILVGLLLSALATELIGIHSIFGAFIFGTIMPRSSAIINELTDKLEDFTVVVLLPTFFAVAGLRANLFTLSSPDLIGWTVVICLIAIVGKVVGSGLAARLTGFTARESLVLGTLMNTRGLTELVILSVGLSLGVLSDRLYAMMVIMALLTTVIAAPAITRLMPRREMVRLLSGGTPARRRTRILVAIGNQDDAPMLVDVALRLVGERSSSAELLLVRLIPTPRAPEFRTGMRDEEMQMGRSVAALAPLVERVTEAGVTARSVSFLTNNIGRDLAEVASQQGCDTILLGWNRTSIASGVRPSLVRRVLHLAACEVVIFVDRLGQGVSARATAPVFAVAENEADAMALQGVTNRLAESVPVEARVSTGNDVGARSVRDMVEVAGAATAVVVSVGRDFGERAGSIAARAACPVLVVRAPKVRT